MEKNNLKDMVKNLKAKTSKALQIDESKTIKNERVNSETSGSYGMEKADKMIGDIDFKIAEFYKNKQAKINSLELDEETHAEDIVKKDISVPSDYDSIISGIKIDAELDEDDDNIGRKVLREFAIDEDTDIDEIDSNTIGVETSNSGEEFDVLLDIASNGDKEVEDLLLKREESPADNEVKVLSDMLKKLPTKKKTTKGKTVERVTTNSADAPQIEKSKKSDKSKADKPKESKVKKSVRTDSKKTDKVSEEKTKKSTKASSKKKAVTLTNVEIDSMVDEILSCEDEVVDAYNREEPLREEMVDNIAINDESINDEKSIDNTEIIESLIANKESDEEVEPLEAKDTIGAKEVESVDTLEESKNSNDDAVEEVLATETEEDSPIEETNKNVEKLPKIDLTADYMKNKTDNRIKVLYVVTECQPFVATGGLADVAGSLPKAIVKEGVDIRVIMPLYNSIKTKYQFEFEYMGNFTVHLSWRQEYCGLFRYVEDGVTYYFIDNERYFKRDNIYGYFDDGERFAYFCKAVVEGLSHLDFFPQIIHCNDWQSALVPAYLKTSAWSDSRYYNIKNIYTIHNVEYQGIFGMENLGDLFGIDESHASELEYDGNINLTKGAIQLSDKVTTVSHSYCDNLKQPYCSRGLHHIIYRNENKLSGILNGVDNDFYNPMTDKEIACNFDINSIENKRKCKKAWQEELGLPVDPDTPLISMVTRLVSHKGLDLITRILEDLLKEDIQFVIVGTGDQRFIEYFRYMEGKYPTKVRSLVNSFSLEYARKNYAGSDIFLMPSKIEPCGISQMIASRYGTVPVVRETGGLRDTIRDFGCEGGGNGYTFANYNSDDLKYQVKRAIKDYHDKEKWNEKINIVMSQDFGWENSAKEYVDLYKSVL